MIDYSILKIWNGHVTLKSVMDFLLRCTGEERWDAFWELTHENASAYPMRWKTFWKSLQFAYSDGRAATSEAEELFREFECAEWYGYSTKKEQKFFEQIGNDQILYRGCTLEEVESGCYGVSWTTDRKIAEFFAYRYEDILKRNGKRPCVVGVKAKDANICGILLERGEKEVILIDIDKDKVDVIATEKTEYYDKYQTYRKAQLKRWLTLMRKKTDKVNEND